MKTTLKPLREQVMVITGASSGIGLATAEEAASYGARVVLAARNETDLSKAVRRIRDAGGRAIYRMCDVSDLVQVEALAKQAIADFGRIDTWVNCAAVGVYGTWLEVSLEDARRQFDVNYWGVVHGTLTAVRSMFQHGGSVINVASALADRAIPLQGNYTASKFAVKAFTESLRMELEADGIPVFLTLVKPGSVDTPLFAKAKTYMGVEPQPIPPVYSPHVVVEAILAAAARPMRDVVAGGMGKVTSLSEKLVPRLADRYMERTTFDSQKTNIRASVDRPTNLYEPLDYDGGEHGAYGGRVRKWSAYTEAILHPRATAGILAGIGMALVAGARRLRRDKD